MRHCAAADAMVLVHARIRHPPTIDARWSAGIPHGSTTAAPAGIGSRMLRMVWVNMVSCAMVPGFTCRMFWTGLKKKAPTLHLFGN